MWATLHAVAAHLETVSEAGSRRIYMSMHHARSAQGCMVSCCLLLYTNACSRKHTCIIQKAPPAVTSVRRSPFSYAANSTTQARWYHASNTGSDTVAACAKGLYETSAYTLYLSDTSQITHDIVKNYLTCTAVLDSYEQRCRRTPNSTCKPLPCYWVSLPRGRSTQMA